MKHYGKKTTAFLAVIAIAVCLAICGCSSGGAQSAAGNLKDGSYIGQSSVLDANVDGDGYVVVSIKVADGKLADASFEAYEPDGTLKDKDYGKDGAYYAVAQKALSAGDDYLEQFKETGDPQAIDAVSGATYLHDMFVEAAQGALDEAAK